MKPNVVIIEVSPATYVMLDRINKKHNETQDMEMWETVDEIAIHYSVENTRETTEEENNRYRFPPR